MSIHRPAGQPTRADHSARRWAHGVEPSRRREMPAADRRLARELLDQQLWCWGCDIRRPEGNLLLEYGFRAHQPSAEGHSSTCYELSRDVVRTVLLWAFGASYLDAAEAGLAEWPRTVVSASDLPAVWSDLAQRMEARWRESPRTDMPAPAGSDGNGGPST